MIVDFKQGLSKQITKLNVATSTFFEETKAKTYITTLENEIAALKAQAGEIGYNTWAAGGNALEEQKVIYQNIATRYAQIQEQQKQIQEMQVQSKQVLGETPAAAPMAVFCPNCGERYASAPKFCVKCGTRMQ